MIHHILTDADNPEEPTSKWSLTAWASKNWPWIGGVAPIALTLITSYIYSQFVKVGVTRTEFNEYKIAMQKTLDQDDDRTKKFTDAMNETTKALIEVKSEVYSLRQDFTELKLDVRELRSKK